MLTCAETREALLTADLDELDGSRAGPLATHLMSCGSCRAAAGRVLAATRGLAAQRDMVPRRTAAVAAARARLESRRVRRVHRVRWGALPLLAAAGLAAVLLVREGPPPGAPIARRPPAPPPLVEGAAGRVAVFTTDNPTIVVVWQF
jgi:hypothetical protein